MLVQVSIGLQWVLSSSSTVDSLCSYATRDHVLALFYVIFLVAFAAALALKSRRYRDNYREAKYIGAVMAVTVPVWAGWILATVVVTQEYHPACVGRQ